MKTTLFIICLPLILPVLLLAVIGIGVDLLVRVSIDLICGIKEDYDNKEIPFT